jgi:gamma-glutamyltranspeptidase / glutathione hydrolase
MMDLSFSSRRSPIYSRSGIVAASQPLAAAAGVEILRQGGTAADAAVAAAAVLNVTEPGSTGLGGDAFCLYYHASSRSVYALNGSGRSPTALTLEKLVREGLGENLPERHPYTVTVPGACAAWCDLVDRFGKLPLPLTLAPAIRLADEGFPVAPLTASYWQSHAAGVLSSSHNGHQLTLNGRGPNPGEIFQNPGLAATLQTIAAEGKEAFYHGQIAERIVAAVQAVGGCLTLDDLAGHTSEWTRPISTLYHGKRIWECPPNGQGLAVLLALNLAEGISLAEMPPLSADRLHLMIECMRLAFTDTRQHAADPDTNPAPLQALLDPAYAAERRKLIHFHQTNPVLASGIPSGRSDTVYLSVIDAHGNACSFINSTYMAFGSGIIPNDLGFSLQNRGHNFSLDPLHPNVLAPHKRPYHTIIPAMATSESDSSLFACFGVMGGFMQPQGHFQVLVNLLDDHLDPQSALDQPRFCIEPDGPSRVSLEEGIPLETMQNLAERGHQVRSVSGLQRALFGRGQIILRNPENGVLMAGSDPRADGCAMTGPF